MSEIIKAIENHAQNHPQKIALSDGDAQKISYQNLVLEINKLVQALENKGFKSLAILADNSPSWIIFDLACLKAKIILTPIPHFFTENQISRLLEEGAVEAVLCDDEKKFSVEFVVKEQIKIAEKSFSFVEIFRKKISKFSVAKVAKITFTSGSTGFPKGVCLGEEQIENVVFSLAKKLRDENLSSNLSLLPLSILLENIAGIYCNLVLGSCAVIPSLSRVGVGGSSSLNLEKFTATINTIKPQSFILVPELAKLLISLISTKKITDSNFKFIAVGGAKISPDLLKSAAALGLPLYQGYGLSEFSSVVSLNSANENKIGSVGKILPHIVAKISTDGEILLKGNLALGYSDLKSMDVDAEGWYKSGDIGHIDEENFLFIDGRKKNIFITSFGRNVNPEWIESELLKSPIILQAAVFGEAKPFNTAIISTVKNVALEAVEKEISVTNKNLPDYAQVKKIIFTKHFFSVEDGTLTGTGRIKRDVIFKKFQNELDQIYS